MTDNDAPVVVVEQTIEANEEIRQEIEAALESSNPVNEQRYNQLLQELRECRNQLESLSTQTTSENPVLSQVLQELARIQEKQDTLALRVESLSMEMQSRIPSSSQVQPLAPVEPVTEELTAEPVPVEAVVITEEIQPPPPRRRVRLV